MDAFEDVPTLLDAAAGALAAAAADLALACARQSRDDRYLVELRSIADRVELDLLALQLARRELAIGGSEAVASSGD